MEPLKITEKTNEQLFNDILPNTTELIIRLKLLLAILNIKPKQKNKLKKQIKEKIKTYRSVLYDLNFSLNVEKKMPNDLKLRHLLKLSIGELKENITDDFIELKKMYPEINEGDWQIVKSEFCINE